MSDSPVNFSAGLPETELALEPDALREAIAAALESATPRAELSKVVAAHPTSLEGWGRLSEASEEAIDRYAFARVGYHRGLDALRKSGWRGSGYVRWSHPGNRGFLRCLERLRESAEAIGETAEVDRCAMFLRQCDPDWRADLLREI